MIAYFREQGGSGQTETHPDFLTSFIDENTCFDSVGDQLKKVSAADVSVSSSTEKFSVKSFTNETFPDTEETISSVRSDQQAKKTLRELISDIEKGSVKKLSKKFLLTLWDFKQI